MMKNSFPYGKIETINTIGEIVRTKRKQDSLSQAECAALCGVGVRFLSDLENGKTTVEIGKVLKVLTSLGLSVSIQKRSWHNVTHQ